ncbi:MAG: outer membrane beta-barrel protein [Bacteroidota bacterium]
MKKLFGLLMLVAAFTFAANNANAQESFGSAGLEIALPVGDFADEDVVGAGFGVGGSGHFEIGLSDKFAVNASAGIIFFSTDVDDTGLNHIPLQVGARYYLNQQKEGLFVAAQGGLHIQTFSVDIEGVDNETDSYFGFAPQVGYFVSENISVSLRYQMVFVPEETESETVTVTNPFDGSQITQTVEVTTDALTLGYIGLRAAYNF